MQLDNENLTLAHYHGTLALVGSSLGFARKSQETSQPHITLLSPDENKALGRPDPLTLNIPTNHVYVLGEGSKGLSRWFVVIWNHADIWRKSAGLPKKDYHISVSGPGHSEGLDKGITSLGQPLDEIVENARKLGLDGMDHVAVASQGLPLVSSGSPLARLR
jgi:hypothetical protein